MTLSHRLARAGEQVTVFEAAGDLGGLARPCRIQDLQWDRYYHVILLSDSRLRSLLAELGLEKHITWAETGTGFFTDGRLHSMSNALEFLRFPPLNAVDILRLACTILYASRIKNWKRLERITVSDWLKRWSGGKTFQKIWLPLLRAKLGEHYSRTSSAFIWATIQRMYAARRSGLKKELFGYVPGGYARILECFTAQLLKEKVTLKPGHAVTRVEAAGNATVRIVFQNGREELCDRLVLTIPARECEKICRGLSAAERHKLQRIEYLGVVCGRLLLKKPLSGFYVTNITDPGIPFTGVIEMSALADRRHFNGNALVYLPRYVTPDDPIFELSDTALTDLFVTGLKGMYPGFRKNDLACCGIARDRYVFALNTLDYSANLPAMKTGLPGVYIINSAHITHGTLNVNETIALAEKAAGMLLAEHHNRTGERHGTTETMCKPVA